jgi:hypothetical protein
MAKTCARFPDVTGAEFWALLIRQRSDCSISGTIGFEACVVPGMEMRCPRLASADWKARILK